ncbi:MAG: FAD-dependent oxidoreductase [Thermoplasmata archaeon]|nr:FAD-dependent oxidoreductase [Thermoplasmata archaeon]
MDRYERVPIEEETREERVSKFALIDQPYTLEQAVIEGQRCLQCAMPYCVQGCPITQDCKGYNILIGERDFDGAARLTLRDNPLSTVLCKTCYHFCEDDCIMAGRGVPIAIRHLKRAALDFGKSDLLYVPSKRRDERVAVIGGGPAGLMAAWDLAVRGHPVTVFEQEPFLGGQVNTIPRYHLDPDDLDTDLARWKNLDVTFVTGERAGPDLSPKQLLDDGYQAVLVTVGASKARELNVPGEHLPGVYHALPFLLAINKRPEGLFGRTGRRVIVIGAGDVALDAARSARRLTGGGEVLLVYRRGPEDMKATEEEKSGGEIEGVRYVFYRSPKAIVGSEHVEGLMVERTEHGPPDAKGRRTLVTVPNSEELLPADMVIVAVGEVADVSGFEPEYKFRFASMGWPEGTRDDTMTEVEGVFATGGRSVVHAMGAGERAAAAIDAYLAKKHGRPAEARPDPFGGKVPPPKVPPGYGAPTWTP